MDRNINNVEQHQDDSLYFHSLALKISPYVPCGFSNRDYPYHPGFFNSPVGNLHELNPSLTLGDFEDYYNSPDDPINYELTRENSLKEASKNPQLYLCGKPFETKNDGDLNAHSAYKKRESIFSIQTKDSESFLTSKNSSPFMASNSREMINLKENEALKNHFEDANILVEKGDRRMSTISLKKFNSFSLVSSLRSQSKSDKNMDKSSKKVTKRLSKNKSSNVKKDLKTSKGKKIKQEQDKNCNFTKHATPNSESKFSNTCLQNENNTMTSIRKVSLTYDLKDTVSEFTTKAEDSNISIEQNYLKDHQSV